MSSNGAVSETPRPPSDEPPDVAEQLHRLRRESDTLYQVIGVVASAPDLEAILARVVGLLTRASECEACIIYLREGDRLTLRAASDLFAHLVGRISFGTDEGLTGWVLRRERAAFIRDNALDDPRTNYISEFEEERFQSMAAVPIPSRNGPPLGVILLHTVAPREFDADAMDFLSHTATIVGGALENARLYDDARRRVTALTRLAELGQRIDGATGRDDLYALATAGVRDLLACDAVRLYELAAGRLVVVAADPEVAASHAEPLDAASVLLDLLGPRSRVPVSLAVAMGSSHDPKAVRAVPLIGGTQERGVLVLCRREGWPPESDDLLRLVAHQIASALDKAELIERLTDENHARDLFAALARADGVAAATHSRATGIDLERPWRAAQIAPAPGGGSPDAWPDRAGACESALRLRWPGLACHLGSAHLRVLLPARVQPEELDALTAIAAEHGVVLGMSELRRGLAGSPHALTEAADACRVAAAMQPAGGALSYENLGAYGYLVNLLDRERPNGPLDDAVEELARYDRRRGSDLRGTLEAYLSGDRNVGPTAREFLIHPNTLRQRLRRIEAITGLDLAAEDLLALELALRLARLRGV